MVSYLVYLVCCTYRAFGDSRLIRGGSDIGENDAGDVKFMRSLKDVGDTNTSSTDFVSNCCSPTSVTNIVLVA